MSLAQLHPLSLGNTIRDGVTAKHSWVWGSLVRWLHSSRDTICIGIPKQWSG
jgi:hypothetical protein